MLTRDHSFVLSRCLCCAVGEAVVLLCVSRCPNQLWRLVVDTFVANGGIRGEDCGGGGGGGMLLVLSCHCHQLVVGPSMVGRIAARGRGRGQRQDGCMPTPHSPFIRSDHDVM